MLQIIPNYKNHFNKSKVCVRQLRSLQMSPYIIVEMQIDSAPTRGSGKLCLQSPTYLVFSNTCEQSTSPSTESWQGYAAEIVRLSNAWPGSIYWEGVIHLIIKILSPLKCLPRSYLVWKIRDKNWRENKNLRKLGKIVD